MMLDLHTHSRHSDGRTTPTENVDMAAAAGLTGIALTDHDTCDGLEEAAEACARRGLRFVPGIELSTEENGRSVHILGYGINRDDLALTQESDRLRHERLRRAEDTLSKLGALGVDLTMDAVMQRAGGAAVARPHIAEALVAVGAVPDLATAFERFLADGAAAYVEKHAVSPEKGVALIRNAGGAAVLAHPAADRGEASPVSVSLLDRLAGVGLGGVEIDHPAHDEEQRAYWRAMALERDLCVTGSSDFHGRYDDERIGSCVTSSGMVDRLAGRTVSGVALMEEK